MQIAWVVKNRSHDAETKHGCVITKDNKIIGTGYNGWPSKIDLPENFTRRPDKYCVMIHAEKNAIRYATSPLAGSTIYVTGKPCVDCLEALSNASVSRIVALKRKGTQLETPASDFAFEEIVKGKAVQIDWLDMEILDE